LVNINWDADNVTYPAFFHHDTDFVRGARDITGDGYDDLLIGRPFEDGYSPSTGYVRTSGDLRVFAGRAMYANLAADQPGDYLLAYPENGFSTAALGGAAEFVGFDATSADVDGDGTGDLVVTPSSTSPAGVVDARTEAWLFYGPITSARTVSEADATFTELPSYTFVSNAGDTNADGYEDLLLGNLQYGGVHLYLGASR
jgi:hypothetical protein